MNRGKLLIWVTSLSAAIMASLWDPAASEPVSQSMKSENTGLR